ncbi:hypothetical protein N657DRAFT_421792 [Parathielavia appendiculata]|uniref:Uncharacterized protein n=1 Tax=Parathielavia appendiculata TaxID=2587402 RepID=A0AAN6Z3K2_9PEZI|nr:hypothetical protein N657DRAFT_421792 [Parathielavia appendiculata]
MPFSWESIVSFFSPPASRNPSPSPFSSPFFNSTEAATSPTKQNDLPMPPTSAFTASASAPIASLADSSSSLAASERDYFPPTSHHRRPSMSSTSTTSTVPSDIQRPHHPPRTHTTPAPATNPSDDDETRPPAPRRAATSAAAASAAVDGPLDPLSREYPKPTHEPSLDELLSRPPLKWSLGHYVKSARERKTVDNDGQEEEEEERRRRFEEAKRNLLRAKEMIDESVAARRR